jgi:hypothetical protein
MNNAAAAAQALIDDAKREALAYTEKVCKPLPSFPRDLQAELDRASILMTNEIGRLQGHIRSLCIELELAGERNGAVFSQLAAARAELVENGLMEREPDEDDFASVRAAAASFAREVGAVREAA